MSESFADTIKPKSDQLNADDLLVSPITVKITGVKRGPTDQPVHIAIEGHQPYKPCKSMRRILISAWGDKGADWVGKSMTLYCDPTVKFGGVALGGIRISHLSDIPGVMNVMLTASRGKKSQFTVNKISNSSNSNSKYKLDDNAKQWIAICRNDKSRLCEITMPEYREFIESNL